MSVMIRKRSGVIVDTSDDAPDVMRHNCKAVGLNTHGERPRVLQRADAPLYIPVALQRARARGVRHEPRTEPAPREGWLRGEPSVGRMPQSKA